MSTLERTPERLRMGGLLLLARDAPSSLEQSAQRLIKSTLLVFEREASSEASSSSRGGASATPRTLLEKPDLVL